MNKHQNPITTTKGFMCQTFAFSISMCYYNAKNACNRKIAMLKYVD